MAEDKTLTEFAEWHATTVGGGGRIVIPAAMRKALGVDTGDEVLLSLVDGEVRISTRLGNIEKIRAMVRARIPEGVSVVDEFLKEKYAEAEREYARDREWLKRNPDRKLAAE